MTEVTVGQTWEDRDGESVRIDRITGTGALAEAIAEVIAGAGGRLPKRPRYTRLLVDRLRRGLGWKLVTS